MRGGGGWSLSLAVMTILATARQRLDHSSQHLPLSPTPGLSLPSPASQCFLPSDGADHRFYSKGLFCPLSTVTASNKDVNRQSLMPQSQTLLSPPQEPLGSLLPGKGGTCWHICSLWDVFQDLAELRGPCCSGMGLKDKKPHSKWADQGGPVWDHVQSGEPPGGKEAPTSRITP